MKLGGGKWNETIMSTSVMKMADRTILYSRSARINGVPKPPNTRIQPTASRGIAAILQPSCAALAAADAQAVGQQDDLLKQHRDKVRDECD